MPSILYLVLHTDMLMDVAAIDIDLVGPRTLNPGCVTKHLHRNCGLGTSGSIELCTLPTMKTLIFENDWYCLTKELELTGQVDLRDVDRFHVRVTPREIRLVTVIQKEKRVMINHVHSSDGVPWPLPRIISCENGPGMGGCPVDLAMQYICCWRMVIVGKSLGFAKHLILEVLRMPIATRLRNKQTRSRCSRIPPSRGQQPPDSWFHGLGICTGGPWDCRM